MTTPSETLRRAASILREIAGVATPGAWDWRGLYELEPTCRCLSCYQEAPWAYTVTQVDGPDSPEGCIEPIHVKQPDARWIALVSPELAPMLAGVLEGEAETLDDIAPHIDPDEPQDPFDTWNSSDRDTYIQRNFGHSLDLARAIVEKADS